MINTNYYDVSRWPYGNPYIDIGEVINNIIDDIKKNQVEKDINKGGKPGAVIYIPPGDYRLTTQVLIDISFLKITGSGHGFTSSSIRFNTSIDEITNWHEVWPGGSRILVDIPYDTGAHEEDGAAFLIKREGEPRISSVEFSNFCIDGLHFMEDSNHDPENSYMNGKTGIYIACPHDSFKINGMGIVYCEHGVVAYHADALSIHDNFIAECGNCIELKGAGQASKITDNLLGAGYKGYTIYASNYGGISISTNNVFPRGASSIYFSGVVRSIITSNRFHSFYPGMLVFENDCVENLISSNHFLRDQEPWIPMQMYHNGLDDTYGLLRIEGSHNSIISNHISESISKDHIKPNGEQPIIIRVTSGYKNYIANNNIVCSAVDLEGNEKENACFSAQVSSILTTNNLNMIQVTAVHIDEVSIGNIVLDTGNDEQIHMDRVKNILRAIPTK